VWTVLGVQFLTGCLPGPDCTIGETRCDGGVLEQCAAHPSAVYGPIDDPQYVHGSGPDWENVADCGAGKCVAPGAADTTAFCALDVSPFAPCGTDDYACDGTTLVTCNAGYAIERKQCSACDAVHGTCDEGTGDACTAAAGCGEQLRCNADPFPTCELPCACPDGAACDACAQSWTQAPDGGPALQWTCQAGLCAYAY
jgi:hypothetical protein